MTSHQLGLHEEVLLVALHDERGTAPQPNTDLAIAASVLYELLRADRIRLTRDKKPVLEVVDPSPLAEPSLDSALAGIADGKRKPLSWWVQRFGTRADLRQSTAGGLVQRGVLDQREGAFFGLGADRYPERDGAPEAGIAARVEQAVLTDGFVDEQTRALVVVLHAADLLTRVVERRPLRSRKQRLSELREGDAVGDTLGQVLEEVQAAVIAATAAATS